MSGPRSLKHYMEEYAGPACSKCKGTMKMVEREGSYIFLCPKNECEATERLTKEDILNYIDMENSFFEQDMQSESDSGVMSLYDDWDPEEMDLETYKKNNGID